MGQLERTVLIGLDGATFDVLDPLMAGGIMPRLADVAARGARADLISTPNPLTPPAWTSLVTGRTPGHHGIFDFVRAEEGEGGLYFTLNASYDIRCETLWSVISRNGGRVASLNFPVSAPPQPVEGIVVPGFVPWRHMRRSVHPRAFYEEIRALPGFDVRELSMDMVEELKSIQWIPDEDYEAWIRQHARREEQWARIALHVLESHSVDLLAVLFDGADKLQHLCWKHVDPSLASSVSGGRESQIRRLCLAYFRELDGHIGRILDAAGPSARVFFASDHGFGATREIFYINMWLEEQGYLRWKENTPVDDGTRVARDRIKSHVEGIDWEATTAFALTPSSNGIFIRRGGAPRSAGVSGGNEAAFRDELARRLRGARHPRTGAPLVRKVMTREEAFPGPEAQRAPDLTLVLEDFGFVSVLRASDIVRDRPEPAGTHRPEGIFLASGPGIRKGIEIDPLSIVDVAPVLVHSLGLAVPSDWEGRVPLEICEPDWTGRHPVRTGEATLPPDRADTGTAEKDMNESDEAVVMARLQALGYLE